VETAFLLLVAKRERGLPSHEIDLIERAVPPGLHFVPDVHHRWTRADRAVALGAWVGTSQHMAGTWFSDDRTTVFTTAPIRVRGRPWDPGGRWAEAVARAMPLGGSPGDSLRGIFSLVTVDRRGEGEVSTDPLGLSFFCYGDDEDTYAVSSHPALTAEALTSEGARPPRDVVGACELAYSGYRVSARTGYKGVRINPPGGRVVFRPGHLELRREDPPWRPSEQLSSLESGELLDLIEGEIAENVISVDSLPGGLPIADLTGGKDSRLVLAVALRSQAAHRLTFRTDGPPDLPDVRVAREIAELLHLDHEADVVFPGHQATYADQLRAFVDATAAVTNAWDLKIPELPRFPARLSGLSGECLRSHHQLDRDPLSLDDMLEQFQRATRFGRLGLVSREAAATYHDGVLQTLHEPAGAPHPLDRFDAFYIRTRARARFGPLDQLENQHRVLALYSIDAIRAAFALGGTERHHERVHFELTRRSSPTLAQLPFVGPGWSSHLVTAPPPAEHAASSPGSPAPHPPTSEPPLMGRLKKDALGRRREDIADILGIGRTTRGRSWTATR
jgi:hypothetical protein